MKTDTLEINTAAHWGPLRVQLKNGKVVHSGSAVNGTPRNELQDVVADQIYSEARVRYPMVRKGYLNGNTDRSLRGRDEWVRVSWDFALDLVANELQRVRQEYGVSGIFGGSYGWYSSGSLHASRVLLHRYLNLTGGFVNSVGDYSTGAIQVIMPHIVGAVEAYDRQTSWEQILKHTELLVIWSGNPLTTLRIAWTTTEQQVIKHFHEFQALGKRIICIDPIRSTTCETLGAEWLPVHTATDVPLILGIAHSLIISNKIDRAFLDKYTTGYDKFEAYLLGKTDGQPKNAQWASEICGVPADSIHQLAQDFASHRTLLMAGWGMQRQRHGEQSHWALLSLAAMLGQVGLAGGGFSFSFQHSGGVPSQKQGVANKMSALAPRKPELFIPVARLTDALLNPHKTIEFNGKQITYPDIKLIYWAGGNPYSHHPDVNLMRRAWQTPETIIINEVNWTATARMADIVLPVTTSYERNDLTMAGDFHSMSVYPMKQVVSPQFEARNDYDIFVELAKRTGVEQAFTEGKSEMQWLAQFYSVAEMTALEQHLQIPNFEQFWQENQRIKIPVDNNAGKFVRYEAFRQDPLNNPLATPSGKIEIYSEHIAQMNYADCQGHATWFEPEEYAGNVTAQYPLALVTPHLPYRLHSQLAQTSLRQKYAINDREPLLIHPVDALARGIENGDVVRVFSARGAVLAGAQITDGIIQGTVALHEGAWYDPWEQDANTPPLCKNGCPNVLTRDDGASKLSQGTAPNTCIVQVEKFKGEAPAVTVFQQPKMVQNQP